MKLFQTDLGRKTVRKFHISRFLYILFISIYKQQIDQQEIPKNKTKQKNPKTAAATKTPQQQNKNTTTTTYL